MPISFSHRSDSLEIMDDLEFHEEVVFQTLRELDFINQWLGGNAVTINAIEKLWNKIPEGPTISIADLGCGSGEMLRLISKKAIQRNKKVVLTGIDANPHIIGFAQQQPNNSQNILFKTQNVFSEEFQSQSFDIVIATLFLHHFSDDELVRFFSSLKKQIRVGIIVNDIHRHPFAYYSIKWLTSVFSRSSMVKFDAPLSVLRAFTRKEMNAILVKAGVRNYELKWKWAFRWQLIIPC